MFRLVLIARHHTLSLSPPALKANVIGLPWFLKHAFGLIRVVYRSFA